MEIDIRCTNCNGFLDGEINNRGELIIDLCPECEESIRKEEYEKGHDEGYDEGYSETEKDQPLT